MRDLNALSLDDLFDHLARAGTMRRLLELARDEDLPAGDVTSEALVASDRTTNADLHVRETQAVIAGLQAIPMLLAVFGADLSFAPAARDGDACEPGMRLGTLSGRLRDVLAVERTLLNLIGRLSGIATLTRRYVSAVREHHAVICDTRKTTPGLRFFEKYAVRCGGGVLHRMGLSDAVLIKDNHIAHIDAGGLAAAVSRAAKAAREMNPGLTFVEVEVDSLDQFRSLLDGSAEGVDMILLDNFAPQEIAQAVSLREEAGAKVVLEASGGVDLDSVTAVAATGVDRIAIGALTHQAVSVDVGLDIQPV